MTVLITSATPRAVINSLTAASRTATSDGPASDRDVNASAGSHRCTAGRGRIDEETWLRFEKITDVDGNTYDQYGQPERHTS